MKTPPIIVETYYTIEKSEAQKAHEVQIRQEKVAYRAAVAKIKKNNEKFILLAKVGTIISIIGLCLFTGLNFLTLDKIIPSPITTLLLLPACVGIICQTIYNHNLYLHHKLTKLSKEN